MKGWYRFPEDINVVPRSEGVYLLSESSAESGIVYVGRADDLQQRLTQHPDPANPCLARKSIRYFAFEVTNNSENRERELIEYYSTECNQV